MELPARVIREPIVRVLFIVSLKKKEEERDRVCDWKYWSVCVCVYVLYACACLCVTVKEREEEKTD